MSARMSVKVFPARVGYTIMVFDMDQRIAKTWVPFASWSPKVGETLYKFAKSRSMRAAQYRVNSTVLHERDMQWSERVIKGTQGVEVTRPRLEAWSPMSGYGGDETQLYINPQEVVEKNGLKPNLYTSKTADPTIHRPVLDLDYGAQLVPSRTNGHWHLYLDKELSWEAYKEVLEVLGRHGIVEPKYAKASIARGFSAVRIPPVQVKADALSEDWDAISNQLANQRNLLAF